MDAPCPLWLTGANIKEYKSGKIVCSPRAGGLFRPDSSTESMLAQLNSEQKGCLSYKIYQHNRRYRILFKVDWLLGPNGY